MNVRFDVFGLDVFGKDFRETAITERVSRHGASIVLARALAPEQVVTLLRRSPSFEAEARIIGQVGICPTGYIYGIALLRAVDLSATLGYKWRFHLHPLGRISLFQGGSFGVPFSVAILPRITA